MTNRFVNPRPQFFDAAGNPLVNGRMFFFESGTDIVKPVFADVNEDIPAPVDGDGAVPLSADGRLPNIFYSGTARVILQNKPIEPVFIQVWDIDGVGTFGSGAAFDAWNSIVEYESGAYVVGSDGLVYKSLQNNNSNNDPIASPTFWEQVSFLRTWNPNITYALGDGGVVGSDGKQYRSLQAANLNNDPVSSPTFWGVNNPFDQSLNTTDNVEFVDLKIATMGQNWTNVGRTVADGGIFTTLDLNGGTADNVVIGGATPAAGSFTTFGTTGNLSFGGDVTQNLGAVNAAHNIQYNGGNRVNFSAQATGGLVIVRDGSGTAIHTLNGISGVTSLGGDLDPLTTETQDIGSASLEWDNIFLQNSPTVSDIRKKIDKGPVEGTMIELMRRLDPRVFLRKPKTTKEAVPETFEMVPETKIINVDKVVTELIDGVPVRKTIKIKETQQVGEMVQAQDENGHLLTIAVPEVKDKAGKVVQKAKVEPDLVFVPNMIKRVIPAQDEVVVTHGRPHTGFMAQSVKALLEELNIEDWAGYAYHNEEGEDTHVLRLLEFIAPMLAYMQEIEKKVQVLEVK